MSIMALVGSLILANFTIIVLGGLLEFIVLQIFRIRSRAAHDALVAFNSACEAAGLPADPSSLAKVSPGTALSLIAVSAIAFASLGVISSFVVARFLQNPDRMDWLWYCIALLNVPPDVSRGRRDDYSLLCLICAAAYVVSSLCLRFLGH